YTLYDASLLSASGKAIDATYGCSASGTVVGFIGYAVTEISSPGLLGGRPQTDLSIWRSLVGTAPETELGGLVAAIAC
ncbi:MAG: hypothetical protein ACT4PT_00615, partial [Methanobacteriota archaeon]